MNMIMKKYLSIIALFLGFMACTPETSEFIPELVVAESEIEATAAKGVYVLTITSNTKWNVSTEADWLFFDTDRGEGNGKVEIEVFANKTYEERNCVVVVKANGIEEEVIIPVTQASAKGLLVDTTVYEIGAEGGDIAVNLQTNTILSAEIEADWITLVVPTRALEAHQMLFSVAKNETADPRTATITLSGDGVESEYLTITQSEAKCLIVEKTSYEIASEGGNIVVDLQSNTEVTATIEVDWITLTEPTRALVANQLVFAVANNELAEPRIATITLSGEGVESVILTVTQEANANPTVVFANETFKTFLINKNYDTDEDGYLSQNELDAVTNITLWRRVEKDFYTFETDDIDNLSDLQYLPNLEELDIQGVPTSLTSLDLSKNTKLRKLNCANTSITSLDLSNNTELTELVLSGTPISVLDLNANTKLQNLSLRGCEALTSVDVSMLSDLRMLNCSYSKVSSLNVANNTNLVALYCNGCGLTELNISALVNLERLVCDDNKLTTLNASNNLQLKSLTCMRNNITSLAVSGLSNLKRLSISHNPISELSIVGNTALNYLHAAFTNFTTIDVAPATALLMLNANDSQIASIDLSKNSTLRGFRLNKTALSELDIIANGDIRYFFADENATLSIIYVGTWFNLKNTTTYIKDDNTKWGNLTDQGFSPDDVTSSDGSWASVN